MYHAFPSGGNGLGLIGKRLQFPLLLLLQQQLGVPLVLQLVLQGRQLFQCITGRGLPCLQRRRFQPQRCVLFLYSGVLGGCLLVGRLCVCNLLLQPLPALGQLRQLLRQLLPPLGRSGLSLVGCRLFPAALLQLLGGIVGHQLPLARLAFQTKDLIFRRSQLGFRPGQLIVGLTLGRLGLPQFPIQSFLLPAQLRRLILQPL